MPSRTRILDLQEKIRRDLLAVYSLRGSDWASVLFAGSGTAAVEAMLASMITRNGKVLIIENGVYGERMSEIAKAYGISCHQLTYKWGQRIKILDVERILNGDPEITDIAFVHHETTTGRLNDVAAIAEIGHTRGLRILVDAVSSFGAEKLEFEKWGITACAATANKCLHGAPDCHSLLFAVIIASNANNLNEHSTWIWNVIAVSRTRIALHLLNRCTYSMPYLRLWKSYKKKEDGEHAEGIIKRLPTA